MSTKNYKLTGPCIVTAIQPSVQSARGTVWNPTNVIDIQEADALVQAGYAEVAKESPTVELYQTGKTKTTVTDVADKGKGKDKPPEGDAKLTAILEGSVAEVTDALATLTAEELVRIGALEAEGKDRKGVADAIAEYDTSGAE